jgi:cystathionine beta-lyase
MHYDFDSLPDRRATESAKWNYYDPDVLPFWVADMDFISPEPVIRLLRERVEHGVFGYPNEIKELRQIIVGHLRELYQWHVEPQDLVFLPGVVKGLNMACHAFASRGEAVLVQTPVYPPFLVAPGYSGATRQDSELVYHQETSTYAIDWQSFEAAITDQTRLFILCSPHNPVGRVWQRAELERMAELCLQRNVLIVSDEIHCDLIYSGHKHIPTASLDPQVAQRTITLMAPSKTYNIAGLEFSFAVIQNPELRQQFQHAHKGLVGGINLMGWVAALAAYRDGQDWLAQLLVYLEANRDFLYETIQRELPGIHMIKPEGTYLAWLDCREAEIPGNPYEFFLRKARVALNDGKTFGQGGEGFVRLNFGCPRNMLVEGLKRMKAALLDE